ncbi:hypothetical protein K438DRAFT_1594344 [Mycena galopus ATCC 62051]|nr:hypothetical protein K438DRAFT_1594344 [Mycena galopus ATCC 62051]
MAASGNYSSLADSDSPLLFLPSELAAELKIIQFIWIGTTAVFFWDIVDNLGADFVLLFRSRIRWAGATYFIARQVGNPFTYIRLMWCSAFPVGRCQEFERTLVILYPIVIPSTSLLFFYRVRAIYAGSQTVTVIFSFVWLVELISCIGVIFATGATNIGPTSYCFLSRLAPYSAAACITQSIFDTGVFVAISYRLASDAYAAHGWPDKFRVFIRGAYLPHLSRAMLVDGQMYYMITVVTNITASVMIFAPGVSPSYRSLASPPNLMLSTLMACRVFRNTKLVHSRNISPSSNVGAAVGNNNTRSLRFAHSAQQRTDDDSLMTDDFRVFEMRRGDGQKSGRGQNERDLTNLMAEAGPEDGLERALI